jgi:hypothetical protein
VPALVSKVKESNNAVETVVHGQTIRWWLQILGHGGHELANASNNYCKGNLSSAANLYASLSATDSAALGLCARATVASIVYEATEAYEYFGQLEASERRVQVQAQGRKLEDMRYTTDIFFTEEQNGTARDDIVFVEAHIQYLLHKLSSGRQQSLQLDVQASEIKTVADRLAKLVHHDASLDTNFAVHYFPSVHATFQMAVEKLQQLCQSKELALTALNGLDAMETWTTDQLENLLSQHANLKSQLEATDVLRDQCQKLLSAGCLCNGGQTCTCSAATAINFQRRQAKSIIDKRKCKLATAATVARAVERVEAASAQLAHTKSVLASFGQVQEGKAELHDALRSFEDMDSAKQLRAALLERGLDVPKGADAMRSRLSTHAKEMTEATDQKRRDARELMVEKRELLVQAQQNHKEVMDRLAADGLGNADVIAAGTEEAWQSLLKVAELAAERLGQLKTLHTALLGLFAKCRDEYKQMSLFFRDRDKILRNMELLDKTKKKPPKHESNNEDSDAEHDDDTDEQAPTTIVEARELLASQLKIRDEKISRRKRLLSIQQEEEAQRHASQMLGGSAQNLQQQCIVCLDKYTIGAMLPCSHEV